MARFLIIEPDVDVQQLYATVLRGLGHNPVFLNSGFIAKADGVLVEPAHPASFEAALRLRHDAPCLPIVCASIHEPAKDEAHLLRAIAYLLKPFKLVELTDALHLALSIMRPLPA
jgi:CheY-like chemotaxis protein